LASEFASIGTVESTPHHSPPGVVRPGKRTGGSAGCEGVGGGGDIELVDGAGDDVDGLVVVVGAGCPGDAGAQPLRIATEAARTSVGVRTESTLAARSRRAVAPHRLRLR
jgi:hypothetical protein